MDHLQMQQYISVSIVVPLALRPVYYSGRMQRKVDRLTILKTKIPNSGFFDLFAGQETETYRCVQTKTWNSNNLYL